MGIFYRYPINSEESYKHCFEIGADGTDLDVQLSKDLQLVLFHDKKLEDGSHCDGYIYSKNWDEIKDCRLKTPLSGKQNIITLTSVLDRYLNKEVRFTFDCKLYHEDDVDYSQFLHIYANALLDLTDKYGITGNSFFETSDTNFTRVLLNKKPGINIFFYSHNFTHALTIANKMNLAGISMENDQVTAEEVKLAHENNKQVTLWNVRTENENIEAIEKYPDHIQSDRLKHLLKVFKKFKK